MGRTISGNDTSIGIGQPLQFTLWPVVAPHTVARPLDCSTARLLDCSTFASLFSTPCLQSNVKKQPERMHHFLDQLRRGLEQLNVRNERLLVAVSGGADSVALLRGLVEVGSEFSLELIVAHFNHRLRGPDSDADADWVRDLAVSLKLLCEAGVVADFVLSPDAGGLEENARTLRYQFLDDAATKSCCRSIAMAHTADDQAETVLHHVLRGTGIAGLQGIPATRTTFSGKRVVRPILAVRRMELESYLGERGQDYRTDGTNNDTSMTRNRLRHVVLPLIREQINPQVDAALCRLAEQAFEIDEFLQQSVELLISSCLIDRQPAACRINTGLLKSESRHLIRAFFCELWGRQNWPRQAMGFSQWNRLAESIQTRETITLPHRIEARFHSDDLLVLRQL